MSGDYEARREVLLPGWNDVEATESHPSLENPKVHPDLCINCSLFMQGMVKYVGENGDETSFTSENSGVQFLRFQKAHLNTQQCRFCRVIQSSNPGRFVDGAFYPKIVTLSRRSDWGLEQISRIEFSESSMLSTPVASLYMVPVPDNTPETPDISSWMSHTSTLECAKIWLETCEHNHDCGQASISAPPTRLLSIGTKSTDIIHLVLGTEITHGTRYATLSHCWGNYKPVQLLSSNLNSFLTSIDFDTLPLTFKEAILTARSMGIPYIWIDSLCIIQDSSYDWETESCAMDRVYRMSSLNIAAAAAADGRAGLFVPRAPHHDLDALSVYQIASHKFRIIDCDHWHNTIESLPLLSRAWVYQERQLAPRNLYFGKNSIAWECDSCRLTETFPFILPALKHHKPVPRLEPWRNESQPTLTPYVLWMRMVTAYTRSKLTFHSDKLIALSGIATRFHSIISKDDYFAGLWKGDLMNHLLWYISSPTMPLPSNIQTEEIEPIVVPSWSWAQTASPVQFHSQTIHIANSTLANKDLATLLDFQNEVESFWTYGKQNRGAYITLATQICKISLVYNTDAERCGCCHPESYNKFSTFFPHTPFATPTQSGQGSPARFYPDFSFEAHERGFTVEDLYCIPLVETIFDVGEEPGWAWNTGLVLVRKNSTFSKEFGEKGAHFKRWGTWKVSASNTLGGLDVLASAFEGFDGEGLTRYSETKEENNDGDGRALYKVTIF